MRTIPLTQDKVAIVDDDDFETINAYKWCAHRHRNTFYAERTARQRDGTRTTEKMHRIILARKLGRALARSEMPDHENGDGLDNRSINVRLATNAQNQRNCGRHSPNPSSQNLGIYRRKSDGAWRARIMINRKNAHLGYYASETEAVIARELYIAEHSELMARSNLGQFK